MVERADPARTGVRAGQVVGLLTAILAAASLLRPEASLYRTTRTVLAVLGVDSAGLVTAVVVGNVLTAVVARYTVCYAVGSLIGVVYDWLDEYSTLALVGLAVTVGLVDATLAVLDTRSVVLAVGYLLVWLAYIPVFGWLAPDTWDTDDGPTRLG